MAKNYFKIALRNLLNKKVYTGINLLGLSVASAFCLLVYMHAQQEWSFDTFHKNSQQIYRLEVVTNHFGREENVNAKKGMFSFLIDHKHATNNMLVHPLVLGSDLKNNFPEIESVVRLQGSFRPLVRHNNQSYQIGDNKLVYAENNFFKIFNFPLKQGNASVVFQNPGDIVVNERAAKKLFGNENAIGKTITIPSITEKIFTVTGVAKDFPANSSFDYDIILPLEANPSYQENITDRSNNHFNSITLLQLKKNTNASAFAKKLDDFAQIYFADAIKQWQANSRDNK